jgi:hypothetical protein
MSSAPQRDPPATAVAVPFLVSSLPILISYHITRFDHRKGKSCYLNSVDNRVVCAIDKTF